MNNEMIVVVAIIASLLAGGLWVCYLNIRRLWDKEQVLYAGLFDEAPIIRWLLKNRVAARKKKSRSSADNAWKKEKPVEEGWYWVRRGESLQTIANIVKEPLTNELHVLSAGTDTMTPLDLTHESCMVAQDRLATMPTVTGYVTCDVRVECPLCDKTLHLNQYPYDDDETEYCPANDEIGVALFGRVGSPAAWSGLNIKYQCCGCKKSFTIGSLDI